MLDIIWFAMMIISLLCAAVTGRLDDISQAVFSGAEQAVELTLFLLGTMCAWMGFLKIIEESGISDFIAKKLSPVIDRLFPEYKNDKDIKGKICMNFSANFLGLGNAATPLGISAMQAMNNKNTLDRPSAGMMLFVVINTASIQLIPMNMAALRAQSGSEAPFGILPEIWITSAAAVTVCILFCKFMERRSVWRR